MKNFLSTLNFIWPYVAAALACAITGWFSFKLGRRWRREYREAIANRREYQVLKSEAQMRAVTTQNVRVDASPQINIGTGVLAQLRDDRHGLPELPNSRAFCPFCGRYGCGASCREALESGRTNPELSELLDDFDTAPARDLVHRTPASLFRSNHSAGYIDAHSGNDDPLDG